MTLCAPAVLDIGPGLVSVLLQALVLAGIVYNGVRIQHGMDAVKQTNGDILAAVKSNGTVKGA